MFFENNYVYLTIPVRLKPTGYNQMENITYLDVVQLSNYIHLSKSTIYKMVSNNNIPYLKLGTRTLFVKVQIDQWVLSGGNMIENIPQLPNI